MKRIILTILICAMLIIKLNAQDKINNNVNQTNTTDTVSKKLSFSIGLEAGIPAKTVAQYSSFIAGASVQAEYLVLKELGVTLNAGYLYFLAKNGETGLSFIPVMGGLRYQVAQKFYLSGQAGTSFYQGNKKNNSTYFTYAAGIGYKASREIDLLAKYEGINVAPSINYSFAAVRIAYTFGKVK